MVYIGNKTSPIRSLSYISIYSHTSILSYSLNVLNMESGSAHQRAERTAQPSYEHRGASALVKGSQYPIDVPQYVKKQNEGRLCPYDCRVLPAGAPHSLSPLPESITLYIYSPGPSRPLLWDCPVLKMNRKE